MRKNPLFVDFLTNFAILKAVSTLSLQPLAMAGFLSARPFPTGDGLNLFGGEHNA
jgi:hypothetical protein